MPKLACYSCGRQIYTVAPLESLFAEERRCPRCGAFLRADRRDTERRGMNRRSNPTDEPGPPRTESKAEPNPAGKPGTKAGGKPRSKPGPERRVTDRRTGRRRGSGIRLPSPHPEDESGWHD